MQRRCRAAAPIAAGAAAVPAAAAVAVAAILAAAPGAAGPAAPTLAGPTTCPKPSAASTGAAGPAAPTLAARPSAAPPSAAPPAAPSAVQPAVQPATRAQDAPAGGEAVFNVFVRSTPVGFERTRIIPTADGWIVQSSGQVTEPVPFDTRAFEAVYDASWQPVRMTLDGVRAGIAFSFDTTFADGAATTALTEGGDARTTDTALPPGAVALPNSVFAAYEALAMRLADTPPDAALPVYVAPGGLVTARVGPTGVQHVETADRIIAAQTYRLTFDLPEAPLDAELWTDERGRLLRVSVPAAALEVARRDIASVSARLTTEPPHPGSERVRVRASGFSLAGTLITPVQAEPPPDDGWPAVLLVPGSTSADRDETIDGVPIFRQLAWALADRGFVVLRYDRRGVGQSGGRIESATLDDYAADARAAVRFLGRRDDIDDDRIVVAGHGHGGWISLITARRERRVKGLVLLATPGTTGEALVLEQQQTVLDRDGADAATRADRVALQTRIHRAVLGDDTWDGIPEPLRRQADTPWFRSLLAFDPADLLRRARQPLLVIHGAADRLIPPHHADRLEQLARARNRRDATVDLALLDGVDHLLAPAAAADAPAEPARADDPAPDANQPLAVQGANRQITPQVADVLIDWIGRTLPAN